MILDKRLYSQTMLYGLIGGTLGLIVCAALVWVVNGIWNPESGLSADMIWGLKIQTLMIFYLPLGLLLGMVLTLIEPVNDTSLGEALSSGWKWMLIGGLLGVLGAVLGGLVGEWVFDQIGGMESKGNTMWVLGRIVGSLILGLFLGISLGLTDRLKTGSNDRFVAGMLGGGLGGILAALVFQFVIVWPELMPIFPIILLSMFTVGAIGSVTFMKTKAVLIGHPENKIFKYAATTWRKNLLSDAPNLIGSGIRGRTSGTATFAIANDLGVMPEHAIIELDKDTKAWRLVRWSPDAVELMVNKRPLTADMVYLKDGDVITFGGTRFRLVLTR